MIRLPVLLFFLFPFFLFAQNEGDTLRLLEEELPAMEDVAGSVPNPVTAARRSAILPGLGQLYNDQHWKIPFATGATFAGLGYSIYQTRQSNRYSEAVRNRLVLDLPDEFLDQLTTPELLFESYNNRSARNLGYLFTAYAYSMNILDAYQTAGVRFLGGGHQPVRAAFYSALLPGMGQFYNQKYWKVPIVYGAMGTSIYFVIDNNRLYHDFRTALITRLDEDPSSFYETTLTANLSNDALERYFEQFRRNRDMAVMITAALYFANIIDAVVDAHLFGFDINDDLSYRLYPTVLPSGAFSSGPGISFSMKF